MSILFLLTIFLLSPSESFSNEKNIIPVEYNRDISPNSIVKYNIEKYLFGIVNREDYSISSLTLANMILEDSHNIYILDIRKKEDYIKGYIPGAVNCWHHNICQFIPSIPKDKKIIVYCYLGQSSGQIVGVLRTAGYNAFSLQGGWNNGWLEFAKTDEDASCGCSPAPKPSSSIH